MSTPPASVTAPVPEGKKLVIVESPAKSKSIAKYLNAVGSGWVVDSSVGHIRDLPKPSDLPADMKKGPFGKFAVDTEHGFTPYYVVHPDKKKKVTELKRKLKDADGNYIWQPAARLGENASLLGYPVTEIETMPDVAANSLSIAFGDFQRGYLIVDRAGVRVLRDPYSAKPYVLFYTTKRVGGGVQNFDAIKVMKFAAT